MMGRGHEELTELAQQVPPGCIGVSFLPFLVRVQPFLLHKREKHICYVPIFVSMFLELHLFSCAVFVS
jgi:hypothetical protein